MSQPEQGDDRDQLLADVSEMYYEEGLTQQSIARTIGVTRSAISRMLSEARRKGIVEIKVRRPLRFDRRLEMALCERFGLEQARVIVWRKDDYNSLRRYLGIAAARTLRELITPSAVLGLTLGTTIAATVDAIENTDLRIERVVQLAGALGAHVLPYDGRALVQRVADALGCDAAYLPAPFIVETKELAECLRRTGSIQEGLEMGRRCDVVLVGIGSASAETSSLVKGGHLTPEELESLVAAGAVGDACGLYFDMNGELIANDYHDRLISISRRDLLAIPLRLGVAGGSAKVQALLGALRGGYMNVLVTNSATAADVLALDEAQRAGQPEANANQQRENARDENT